MNSLHSNRIVDRISKSVALAALSAAVLAGLASTAGAQQGGFNGQQQDGGGLGGGGGGRRQQQLDQTGQDQQGFAGGGGRRQQMQQDPNNPDQNFAGGGRRGGRGGRGGQGGQGGFNDQGFNGRQQYASAQNPTGDTFADEYGDLSLHNIFLRMRGIPPRPERGPEVPRSLEDLNVLVGIVKPTEDGGVYLAFIEDASRNTLQRVYVDGAVANGKITEITSTGITYKAKDKDPITVPIGSNLNGFGASVSGLRVSNAINRSDYTGFNAGQNNLPLNGRGNFNNGFNNNNNGGGGGRRGGGFNQNQMPTQAAPAPAPLPGSDGMSLEERMRMRRASEGMPTAAVQQSAPTEAAPAAAPAAEQAPAPAPIVDPAVGGNLTIEEQMRLRRQIGG